MKIFPPQLKFLFCLNQFKQNDNALEKKAFSFLRFLNVEKSIQKFLKRNNNDIVPDETTSGNIVMQLYLFNFLLMTELKGIKKSPHLQRPTLQFYNSTIPTSHFKERFEFETDFSV